MAVRIDWDRLRHVKFANVNTPPEWPPSVLLGIVIEYFDPSGLTATLVPHDPQASCD
jgi:hypothetical protein